MTESHEKYAVVPDEMKSLEQWVIWGINDTKKKLPYTPSLPSVEAKANDSATWADFATAVAAIGRLGRGGIGFEFGVEASGIAGIDLDHVINGAGELEEWAAEIVALMDSYTEVSPSGDGLHIWCKSSEPMAQFCSRHSKNVMGKQKLEMYDSGRYFTVTGQVYGELKALNERTAELKKVCAQYFGAREQGAARQAENSGSEHSANLSNAELWERMYDAPNGRRMRALHDGDISGYGSASEADLALCNDLAYWTNCDARRMDEMFRETGLMRGKWDEHHGEQTYGEKTIAKAIQDTPSYTPPYSGSECASSKKGVVEREASKENTPSPSVEAKEEPVKPVSYYLPYFLEECLKSREGLAIPTGFTALDKLLDGGLYPGLYFMGAISSLGKTTLALQIADNIAKSGRAVMIFSLEMSRSEMMAKTLSRESLLRDRAKNRTIANALTTRGILRASFKNAEQERLVHEVIEEYAEWGEEIAIIEGVGDVGVKQIKSYVEAYRKTHDGQAPVVVIDYLQILAPYNEKYTDKQNVDKNVLELKRLSRDYKLQIIGISSFNRENYKEEVSMAAFKESGAIEYGADVLIGLQVEGIDRQANEPEKDYKSRIQGKLKAIDEYRRQGEAVPVEAKILKNRNGVPGRVYFKFYSRFNYFEEKGSEA